MQQDSNGSEQFKRTERHKLDAMLGLCEVIVVVDKCCYIILLIKRLNPVVIAITVSFTPET